MNDVGALAWPALVERASDSYRPAGRFALHFARGKLRWDPVFPHLLQHGLIAPGSRVLDIGCGQGLLASLFGAANEQARRGRWPAGWAPPPTGVRLTGIELSARAVTRARDALGDGAEFVCGDMRRVAFPPADTVVILDVLHYVERHEQDEVLARARTAIGDGGTLLLRVGDAGARRRFALGQWVDRAVLLLRGRRARTEAGRPVDEWIAQLAGLGFQVAARPMSAGTPFANVLLVAHLRSEARRMKTFLLDHAGIEARIPHRGTMCLLDRLIAWDEGRIECLAADHRHPAHPLRSRGGLSAAVAIEYAAQAAALHGGLRAEAAGRSAAPGYLASARDVRLGVRRLDDLPPSDDDVLRVVAERQAGDDARLLYAFRIEHAGQEIASGRLAVVLGTEVAA